jgi:hypothetical protein
VSDLCERVSPSVRRCLEGKEEHIAVFLADSITAECCMSQVCLTVRMLSRDVTHSPYVFKQRL